MSGYQEKADPAVEDVGKVHHAELNEKHAQQVELSVDANLLTHAYDAENAEHEMTAWQAVKAHPAACFWAFLMCFTIVSGPSMLSSIPQLQCPAATDYS